MLRPSHDVRIAGRKHAVLKKHDRFGRSPSRIWTPANTMQHQIVTVWCCHWMCFCCVTRMTFDKTNL